MKAWEGIVFRGNGLSNHRLKIECTRESGTGQTGNDVVAASEDLDFVIPMGADALRSQRSRKALWLKEALAALPERRQLVRQKLAVTGNAPVDVSEGRLH
jgi:hypothetical protein